MERYIITIGGSGSKCLESLIYLGSMGVFAEDVNILHIDTDKDNGNWTNRAFCSLSEYSEIKNLIGHDLGELFPKKFNKFGDGIFYPLPVKDHAVPTYYNSLEEYFPNRELTGMLYSTHVRNDHWDVGFKGRASLGSIVVVGAFDWEREPWNTIGQQITNSLNADQEVRIFLIGSIFGGAGASIFPSLARLFNDKFGNNDNFKISGLLLFPYFQYTIPKGERDKGDFAKPENFLPKSKLHLQYYATLRYMNPLKRIYILGENYLKSVHPGKGGLEQENPSHHLEPLAIMLAKDFFRPQSFGAEMEYKYLSRANDPITSWRDLPDSQNTADRFLIFTTMACSFLGFWHPLIRGDEFKRCIWFKQFLGGDSEFNEKLDKLKGFFGKYLYWLLGMHVNCDAKGNKSFENWLLDSPSDANVHLFDASILKDFLRHPTGNEVGEKLGVLKWRPDNNMETGYYTNKIPLPYNVLWKTACKTAEGVKSEYNPFERLLKIIHEASKNFVSENYRS